MADNGSEEDPLLIRFRKMSKPVRVVYARPRAFISIAAGIAAFLSAVGLIAAGDAAC